MFIHSWNKTLNLLITTLFAVLLFFVPLVFWPTSELFEFNKMMLTYLLTGLIASTWLIQGVLNRQIKLRRTSLDLPILLFFLGQLISTIFSIDPHTSIWGYYSRFHGGLASTISYVVLYYLAVSHFSQKENHPHFRFLLYSLLTSTTLVAFYGILEHFGIDKDLWVQDVQNRVFSTLGQPNWLSAFLLGVLPIPLYLIPKTKDKRLKAGLFTITLSFLIAIFYTKSRSGIATTAVVLFLITLHKASELISLKAKIKPSTIYSLTVVLFLVLIPTTLFFKPTLIQKIAPYNLDLNALVTKDLELRGGGSDSMVIRAVVWKGAVELFRRHPLVGTGPETFGYSYYWVRPIEHNLLSEWDFLYNKAHNEYLNFLATTGIVGFLSYLFLILASLNLFLRTKQEDRLVSPIALGFGYLSILITNYFGFSVVPVALLFFLYPAFVVIESKDPIFIALGKGWQPTKKELKKGSKVEPTIYQYLGFTVLLLLALAWTILLTRHWLADVKFSQGKNYSQLGYVSEALPLLESSVNLYPNEPNFRSTLAETYAGAALLTKQQLDSLPASQAASLKDQSLAQQKHFEDLAIKNIDQTLQQNPWHLNYVKSQAKIYLTLAQIDPEYYQNALNSLLKANELAPTDSKVVYNIGLLHLTLNNEDQAEIALRQAVTLRPNYDQALIELIKLLTSNEDKEAAQKYVDQLLHYYPAHPGQNDLRELLN